MVPVEAAWNLINCQVASVESVSVGAEDNNFENENNGCGEMSLPDIQISNCWLSSCIVGNAGARFWQGKRMYEIKMMISLVLLHQLWFCFSNYPSWQCYRSAMLNRWSTLQAKPISSVNLHSFSLARMHFCDIDVIREFYHSSFISESDITHLSSELEPLLSPHT